MTSRGLGPPGGSRQRVLGVLRATSPQPVVLPDSNAWHGPVLANAAAARVDAFAGALEDAGATVARIQGEAELARVLEAHPPYAEARRVVSGLAEIGSRGQGAVDVHLADSFADIDVTLAPGRFGVAESGAVWCDGQGLPHRATYFLCQHLVLVVRADSLVDTLHDAYRRLGEQPGWCRQRSWSGFIAGPSKTADIEQALVVGAHGPRSLLVVLIG